MPVIFVLIWSTGFVVARFDMRHSPPTKFLAIRYALSVGCFVVWALASGAGWPRARSQWLHLAVTGVLMHGIYLGGVTAPLALLEPESMRWSAPHGVDLELLGAMAWSVFGLTLGGSSLLCLLIQRGAATSVTSLFYLVPPTTVLMAWALFGEPITVLVLAGTALTALGVAPVVCQRAV